MDTAPARMGAPTTLELPAPLGSLLQSCQMSSTLGEPLGSVEGETEVERFCNVLEVIKC